MKLRLNHLALTRPLAFVDLETTSLSVPAARVVEIAIVRVGPGGRERRLSARLDPGVPIPPAATAVHAISDWHVRGRPRFGQVAPHLAEFLSGCDLAGYNLARYDLPVLCAEFRRAGVALGLAGRAVVDPYQIFSRREPRDLGAAVAFYLGERHPGAHSATADALAAARVLDAQVGRYPDLPADAAGLHRLLVGVDVSGRFRLDPQGGVAFASGKYAGVALGEVAERDAGYLRWMLGTDLLDDARELVEGSLAQQSLRDPY